MAFLQRFSITIDEIQRLFRLDGDIITPAYNYETEDKSHPDIHLELGCLLALQNALANGKFEFQKDDLKDELVRRNGFTEFLKHLKRRKTFYYNVEVDPVRLSDKGVQKLAEVVRGLLDE